MKKYSPSLAMEGNANQNNIEIPSHQSQNGYCKENKQQQTPVRIYLVRKEHRWWECVATMEIIWRFIKKLKVDLPYDLAIPVLGIYPEEYKPAYNRDICTSMFFYSTVYNSQVTESAQVSFSQCMDKENLSLARFLSLSLSLSLTHTHTHTHTHIKVL
jgi:hypothetical protein